MARSKEQVKSIPHGAMGLIGYCTFSLTGGVISALNMWGCIKSVTASAGSVATINLWPPQKYYTVVGQCDETGSAAGYLNLASTGAATTPVQFQVQAAGASPVVAQNSPWVGISVYGFIQK